ncbi:MAG TPA: hypothetical protein VKS60_19730, partial [Stellaceae bacterium]|nr:hypothetical protein [Stellaceae bacterium]
AYPAVRLFVDRAAAAVGGFALTADSLPAIVGICRRLDGIALALELAAPRLKMMRPEALLARLDDRFRLLTGGARTALPRQQTLRALIDWSHDLLGEKEKALMRRLSVFAGGWTIESATSVAADDSFEDWEVFDLLASLVDKSLVQPDPAHRDARYHFLESTRAYAAEKLNAAGEGDWPRRLAQYLAGELRRAETEYETAPTLAWRAAYCPEIDNLRAALDWAFGPAGDAGLGLEMMAYSSWVWSELGLTAEERRRLAVGVNHLGEHVPAKISARLHYMQTAVRAVGLNAVRDPARRAVELARLADDKLALGRSLVHLARTLMAPATLGEAKVALDEALSLAHGSGRTKLLAAVLNHLAAVAYYGDDRPAARRYFEQSLEVARAVHDVQGINAVVTNLAELLFGAGDVVSAISMAREGVAAAREVGEPMGECAVSANLGAYLMLHNETEEGAAVAASALRQARALEQKFIGAWAIQHLAHAAATRGRLAEAARLQGYVDSVYAAEHAAREPTEQLSSDRVRAILEQHLAEADVKRLLAEGAAAGIDEAVETALREEIA